MIKNAKGLIALDIDGTITTDMRPIPSYVVQYLTELNQQGWLFVFITGRTFDFGFSVLKELPFSYFYAVQNGAILLSMPNRIILNKKYLNVSVIPPMAKICQNAPTDFVIYAGYEFNNQCFYRKNHFSDELLKYLAERCKAYGEEWVSIESFDQLPMKEFPSMKCFGKLEQAQYVAQAIENELALHVPIIKDPFSNEYYVVQATHSEVSKGYALKDLVTRLGYQGNIIAAGDDLNDISMFDEAHIKIAMENAPEELKARATIIAPPASLAGIVEGLKQAIRGLDQ